MKKLIYCLLITPFLFGCSQKKEPSAYLYHVDALDKVLKERGVLRDDADTIRVARGESASIQVVVKAIEGIDQLTADVSEITNGKVELKPQQVGLVGYVKSSHRYSPPSVYMIHSPSNYYPDPIYTDTTVNLLPGELQPVWVTVPIPANCEAGIYTGKVLVSGMVDGRKVSYDKPFTIKVYPVTVKKPSLWVTNWMNFSPTALAYMNNMENVETFSDLYWNFVQQFATTVSKYGQNMHRIFPLWLTKYSLDEKGQYTFDFSNFDKEVSMFDKAGALDRIEGGAFGWRAGEWDEPYSVEVPVLDPQKLEKRSAGSNYLKDLDYNHGLDLVLLPLADKRSQNFYGQYLPALKKHLQEKGWYDRYVQHIGDEPIDANADSYIAISKYIKQYMPEVKTIDALMASKKLTGSVDIWIPLLDIFEKDYDFFMDLQKKGKEVWMYTCAPLRGDYANRYVELPLILTRYMHWVNYKYNATGYLHWGLNFWSEYQMPIVESGRHRGEIPGGDAFILYPGYHKLYSSIRFEAMRDGIFDYELLRMLEKTDPEKAKSFANEIVPDFDRYDEDIVYFRNTRKQILELLSQK